jgi:DNA-binding CsgD family transcriptional regulator
MADILEQTALLDALTDKQREVIALVSEGMTSKEIARKLGISASAVNQRIEVTRQRLGGLSRAQIARIYRQTSTLVITIPTSNSHTGKSIQLQRDGEAAQQSSPEGAEALLAFAHNGNGVLQPSTFSPHLIVPPHSIVPHSAAMRLAIIVAIACGLLASTVLVLTVAQTLNTVATLWR